VAERPIPYEELLALYGPHLNYTPTGGWDEQREKPPDRLVKTHCCFCGQQCGIQLKVRDNQVVGFEPWRSSRSTRGCSARRGSSATCRTATPTACSIR
jgi:assimilatory nitrate reductase catalytic subunit